MTRKGHNQPHTLETIMALTTKVGDCLEMAGSDRGTGYRSVQVSSIKKKGNLLAHRAVWMLIHGPIPSGMIIMHRCDNRLCVNPEHLKLGTYKDNMQDCLSKGRWRKFSCRNDQMEVAAYANQHNSTAAMAKFGISRATVFRAKRVAKQRMANDG